MRKILASMMKKKQTDTWSLYLPEVQYIMNTQLNSVTKGTPYKKVFGMQPNLELDGIIDDGNEEEETSTEPSTSTATFTSTASSTSKATLTSTAPSTIRM
jgi:hypothetical protein